MSSHLHKKLFISFLLIIFMAMISFPYALIAAGSNDTSTSPSAGAVKKTITMGTSPDYPPYESVDAKNNGEIIGLDIDIAKYIANQLGYELKISSMDFNGLIAALQTGRVDFVMSGMSVTEERQRSVEFSNEYYVARNTIVSKSGNNYQSLADLEGKRIGVQLGSLQEQIANSLTGVKIKKLNDVTDLIQELNSNRIDVAIIEDAVAVGFTEANPDLSLNFLPSSNEDSGYAIAFPKQSPYVGEFNRVLGEMKNEGVLASITARWFESAEQEKSGSSFLNLDFSVLKDYAPYMLRGIYVTLLFTMVSALFGFIWGTILSLFKISNIKPLKWFATLYTSVFRGTPLLLQLTIIYYATPQIFHYDIPALLAAGLAFGLNSAAYLSETIRAGITSVDPGQREAALALGIPYRTMMVSIIMPQALRTILPALVNECVALVKESSLVSVIGVADLMRRANVIQSTEYRALEPLLFAGVIYYVLVLVLTSFARLLERRLRRSD